MNEAVARPLRVERGGDGLWSAAWRRLRANRAAVLAAALLAGVVVVAALGPWGEETIKRFVHEAIDEALKLESALARLRSDKRIVLLHYSPIEATVIGEPAEIFPFLGSSRLEEPLNRYPVTAVFHGHAHHGAPEGRTKTDVPVYNVAMKLLQRVFPDRPAFRIMEIPES